MKRRVTIADVAREAGVVQSTVSYGLNNTRYVSPETKAAVFAAIEKLKYQPSRVAQGFSRGQMMSIGVLSKDTTSPFHFEIVKGIEEFLEESPYKTITTSSTQKGPEQDAELLDLLIQRGADGMIIVDVVIDPTKLRELAEHTPLIIVNRLVEGLEQNCITINNYQSGYDATAYLISLGHTKIAHLVAEIAFPGSQQRLDGYYQALKDAGLPILDQLVIPCAPFPPAGSIGTAYLLDNHLECSAIFAGNDLLAYDVLSELYRREMRVPDTLSVISQDDYPLSMYTTPALTTMHTPLKEVGFTAGESLLKLLEGQEITCQEFKSRLVIRGSTAPFHG